MTLKLTNELLKYMSLFKEITNVETLDCVLAKEKAFFIVKKGKVGLAIGKNGKNIKKLQNLINKKIIVLELTERPIQFLKNLLKPIGLDGIQFEKRCKEIVIRADRKKKGRIIGRDGSNIKLIRKLLKRHFDLEKIKVR